MVANRIIQQKKKIPVGFELQAKNRYWNGPQTIMMVLYTRVVTQVRNQWSYFSFALTDQLVIRMTSSEHMIMMTKCTIYMI